MTWFFGSNESEIVAFKKALNDNFKMKDLSYAKSFLAINIQQDVQKGVTTINQENYLKKILAKHSMSDCKPISTPIDQNFNFDQLKRDISESIETERICRQIIGSLLYAASGSRPDLCVVIGFLSRYQHCASEALYKVLKRVLRYIKGKLSLSLVYNASKSKELTVGYVDADWAGDVEDRKSTTGYIFSVYGSVISWSCRKQSSVALSSTEAEYVALSCAITKSVWLKNVMMDLGVDTHKVKVFEDNQFVIKIAENHDNSKRLKHLDIRYHFIIENVKNGTVELMYVRTDESVTDILTKPLAKQQFEKFRGFMLV